MMRTKGILIIGTSVLIIAAAFFFGGRLARKHVNYITEAEGHPVTCWNCHLYTHKDNLLANLTHKTYVSPLNLDISGDGKTLYVVGQESNELLVVDLVTDKVQEKIAVGYHPHSVVLDHSNTYAYVTNQWADNIYRIDLESRRVVDTLSGGSGPAGLVISPDDRYLWCVNSYSNNISVFDLKTLEERRRLVAGNNPVSAAMSPDGSEVYVSSRRSVIVPHMTHPLTEMTISSTKSQHVSDRKLFQDAYIMESVRVTPSGDMALATLIRPKNLVPAVQIERGWMMTEGLGIVERESGRTMQLLLDEPNAFYSDPFGLVITPDGKRAFVSHGAVDKITAIDLDELRKVVEEAPDKELEDYANHLGLSSRYVLGRITTGPNPKGMVLSPDGKWLYVAERLNDRIAVIGTDNLNKVKSIGLDGPKRVTTRRFGRQLLNNAKGTFQNQYACYTCHPDGHEDGLVYNMAAMGRNMVNVQTLRDIGDIPPYKWNGKNQSIYKQDGMRFSTFLTRNEVYSHKELDALVAYIVMDNPNPPNLRYHPNGELTASQQRGKELFYRTHDNLGNEIPEENRCYTCHPPPNFTNLQMADVGSLAEYDDSIKFDVPQLNNVYESPPYLHDGRAQTLEEIWTKYGGDDRHGVVNDMVKDQLNDLVEYLKSIGEARYYKEEAEVFHAGHSRIKKKSGK